MSYFLYHKGYKIATYLSNDIKANSKILVKPNTYEKNMKHLQIFVDTLVFAGGVSNAKPVMKYGVFTRHSRKSAIDRLAIRKLGSNLRNLFDVAITRNRQTFPTRPARNIRP